MSLRTSLRKSLIQVMVGLRLDELAIWLERSRTRVDSPRVLVVEMHETPRRYENQLRRQLEWVACHFSLIGADTLFQLWEDPRALSTKSKPTVLFTFDDGR